MCTYSFLAHNIPTQRHIAQNPVENRTHAQGYPNHSYSKSPAGHSQNQNTSAHGLSHSNSATKSPYLVSNPFPSYYVQENQQQENYENGVRYNRLNPKNITNQINNQQTMPNNEFNPNSFYNQHSQYRNVDPALAISPLKENIERHGYGHGTTNQLLKKNFEDLSQQNKQKRLAEEALRGFENQNTYYQMPNNRYNGYDNAVPDYNTSNNQGFPVNGYSGPRNIHSHPVPHEHLESDAFGYTAGNVTHQVMRGRQQENNTEGSKNLGYSKTSYKPYSLREYKDTKKPPTKLGGLGPNINTEEWQKTKEKKDRMAEFSQNVKMFNAQRTFSTESSIKPRKEKEKEASKREVALQFAKNIPKPRPKREYSQDEESPELVPHKSHSDKPVTYGHNDLDELEQRHMQYLAQLERMKLN